MTIDEAIEQFKYDAKNNRVDLDISYAEENEQIAEWLEELKKLRETLDEKLYEKLLIEKLAYNKAIDELSEIAMKQLTDFDLKHGYITIADCKIILRETAEQLKEGGSYAGSIQEYH